MGHTTKERSFQVVFKIHVVFGQRPQREPKGTRSCRIQGESVCHVHPYARTSIPPPPPPRLAQASQRLAQASQRLTQASQMHAQVSERLVQAILKLAQAT